MRRIAVMPRVCRPKTSRFLATDDAIHAAHPGPRRRLGLRSRGEYLRKMKLRRAVFALVCALPSCTPLVNSSPRVATELHVAAVPTVAPSTAPKLTPPDGPWPDGLAFDDPYRKALTDRVMELLDLTFDRCKMGWTGSVDLEIREGKILSMTDTEQKLETKFVGKAVPPIPPRLAAFFRRTVIVGICAAYVRNRN